MFFQGCKLPEERSWDVSRVILFIFQTKNVYICIFILFIYLCEISYICICNFSFPCFAVKTRPLALWVNILYVCVQYAIIECIMDTEKWIRNKKWLKIFILSLTPILLLSSTNGYFIITDHIFQEKIYKKIVLLQYNNFYWVVFDIRSRGSHF